MELRKKRQTANRDEHILQLTLQVERAAGETQELAQSLVELRDVLPKNTSRAAFLVLDRAIRRLKSVSASLVVELEDPDEDSVNLLARLGRRAAVGAAIATTVAASHVGAGFAEEVGASIWDEIRESSSLLDDEMSELSRLAESVDEAEDDEPLASAEDDESARGRFQATLTNELRQTRIVTDLRPIWPEDGGDDEPSSMSVFPVHTLRLTYDDDENREQTVAVSLTADQISALQQQVDRALRKIAALETQLEREWHG